MVNHAWSAMRARLPFAVPASVGFVLAWLLTFVAVIVGWVLFRSHSITGARLILAGMTGLNGGSAEPLPPPVIWVWCTCLGAIALLLPNTQEIMRDYLTGVARTPIVFHTAVPFSFRRSVPWAMAVGAMLAAGLMSLPQPTSFLYFNF
jgi:hypothetical protein